MVSSIGSDGVVVLTRNERGEMTRATPVIRWNERQTGVNVVGIVPRRTAQLLATGDAETDSCLVVAIDYLVGEEPLHATTMCTFDAATRAFIGGSVQVTLEISSCTATPRYS